MTLATHQLRGSGPHSIGWLIGGSIVLGVAVSWGATALWNLASARLSAVSAGMLVNVETVAGYVYVYAAKGQWPPLVQVAGFALLILGVLIVVRLPAAAGPDGSRARAAAPASRPHPHNAPAGRWTAPLITAGLGRAAGHGHPGCLGMVLGSPGHCCHQLWAPSVDGWTRHQMRRNGP